MSLLLCEVDERRHTHPCSTFMHFISQQSPRFDVILHFVLPSSLWSSTLPSPLYFCFHCPPSYVAILSSPLVPLQPPFLDFRCPHYSFISYLVQLRNSAHPSYHSNFCDLQFTTVLHTPPLNVYVYASVAQHSRSTLCSSSSTRSALFG